MSNAISNSGIILFLDLDIIQGDIPNQFCKNLLYFFMHKDCPEISWTMCYAGNMYHHLPHLQSWLQTGPRLNIKTVLSTYGDFHVKDKTAVRTSYL